MNFWYKKTNFCCTRWSWVEFFFCQMRYLAKNNNFLGVKLTENNKKNNHFCTKWPKKLINNYFMPNLMISMAPVWSFQSENIVLFSINGHSDRIFIKILISSKKGGVGTKKGGIQVKNIFFTKIFFYVSTYANSFHKKSWWVCFEKLPFYNPYLF